MGKIVLLCGKVCSGKSTYANRIRDKYNAVILSCDELMLSLFKEQLGEGHEQILKKTQSYLYRLAERIARTGTTVILDFGFWSCAERQEIRDIFRHKNIATELHYVKVSPEAWLKNIKKRNEDAKSRQENSYYIDENMKRLFDIRFQEPAESEIDVLIYNF